MHGSHPPLIPYDSSHSPIQSIDKLLVEHDYILRALKSHFSKANTVMKAKADRHWYGLLSKSGDIEQPEEKTFLDAFSSQMRSSL